MNKSNTIIRISKRFYNLRFHDHDIISTEKKVVWMIATFGVYPACYWAYGFMNRAKERRLEREAKYGAPFFKPFPRDIRPLPWGDGQTPFFQQMKKYWGFEDHKHE